jgi:hypothetical protein
MKQLSALLLPALLISTHPPTPARAGGGGRPSPQESAQSAKPQSSPAQTPAPAAKRQEPPSKEDERKEAAKRESVQSKIPNREAAVGLLVKESRRARFIRRASDSARVLTAVADPLWTQAYYEHIAEDALRAAWKLTGRDLDDEAKSRRAERAAREVSLSTHELRTELRSDILAVAERRKPALVKEFLAEIEETEESAAAAHNLPTAFGTGSLRQQQLANAALRLAATDPARSVSLASASLGYGMPQELQGIFIELAASAPAHARELFRRAVPAFAADQSVNIYDAVFLAAYLRFSAAPEPDAALVKTFLDAALERMLRLRAQQLASGDRDEGQRGAMLMSLNYLQPFFQSYHPERLNELAALAQQLRPELPAGQFDADAANLTSSDNPNTPENLVSRAASEKNQNRRDALYLQAALKFASEKKFDRALEAALSAREGSLREPFLTHVRTQQAEHLAATGELNESAKVVERITDPELRAEATVVLAAAAVKKKDAIIARYALDQTVKALGNNVGSAPHARAYLWIASAYAAFDSLTGFELMQTAVRFANSAAQLQDLRPERRILRVDESVREVVMTGGSGAGDFRAGFAALARADFPRAAQVAETFTNPLFRGLAVVAAAEQALREQPQNAAPRKRKDESK